MAKEKFPEMPTSMPSSGLAGRAASRFMVKEKARNPKETWKKLFSFYAKEANSLFVVSGLLLFSSAASVFIPFLVGLCVDAMTNGVELPLIFRFGAALTAIYFAVWTIGILQGLIMNKASQRIVRTLRTSLFQKLQRLPLVFHDTHTHGELMSRLTNDIDNISGTIAQSTSELISAAVTVIGSFVIMLILSPVLTLVSLITVPLVFLLTRLISKRSRKMFAGQQRELGKLNGLIEESIAGRRMVIAFNMNEHITASFKQNNKDLTFFSVQAQIWSGFLMPFMNVITNLGYVAVMFAGGALSLSGSVLVGTVASFGTYSRQFAFPLNNIAGLYNNLQSALAGAERVFEILEENDEPADLPDAVDIGIPHGEVEFKNVSFSYLPGVEVLKNVNFKVSPGQKVALVGETGAGKTTIASLLTRFYDASSGQVLLDGLDIKKYKRDSLRNAFSVVLQDTCLFSGTIADNIRYAVPDASIDDVKKAAQTAGADVFIERLKNGFDTVVSGDQSTLSQGQRQLLAISRAVLCSAPILILDEATSSVDTRTELKIREALARLSAGRTTFIIAHRLSTIRDADIIMVIKDGHLAEKGSHKELVRQGGIYKTMFESQAHEN